MTMNPCPPRTAAAALLVIALSTALPARAEESPPPEAVEAARRGRALFDERRYAEAVVELEAAYDAFPAPALLHNLGRCHEEQRHWCDAASYYRRFLREGAPSGAVREEVVRSISELEELCDESGSGDEGSSSPSEGPPPGVTGRGDDEGRVGPGEVETSEARLFGGAEPEPTRRTATTDLWGGLLIGLGAALGLSSGVMWGAADAEWPCMLPDPQTCDPQSAEEGGGLIRSADALLYSGIAMAAVGLVVLLVGRFGPSAAEAEAPEPGIDLSRAVGPLALDAY